MELKFRSLDEQSSPYFPAPQNFSPPCFSQQAIAERFSTPDMRRQEFPRDPSDSYRYAMLRELEKERIREKIIAEEIIRRRILEEEVRREIMMEREMALRFGSPGAIRFEPRSPLQPSLEFGVGVSTHREVGFGGLERLPFRRDPEVAGTVNGNYSDETLREIKGIKAPAQEINKDKVLVLAKPNVDFADLKRKVTASPSGPDLDLPSVVLKKHKTKDSWSCALCHLTATSERALNDHLQGRRHKARERGFVAGSTGFGVDPLPQKMIACSSKPVKVPGVSNTPGCEKRNEKVGAKPPLSKPDETPTQNAPRVEDTMFQKENPVEEKEHGDASTPQKTPASAKPKKVKFWCGICQVGTHSQTVLNSHKQGKKHQAKLLQLDQIGESAPEKISAQAVVSEENEEPDVSTKEMKKETTAEQVEGKEGKC